MTKLLAAILVACLATAPAEAHQARNAFSGYSHSPHIRKAHQRPRLAGLGHVRRHASARSWHNASVFCDRVTASGGMNCGAMQFAHLTLPLGSWHNLCSGSRCVSAKVVDRGPFIAGREFDLSPGLARALGIDGLGYVTRR